MRFRKRRGAMSVAAAPFRTTCAAQDFDDIERPLWEAGLGVGGITLPHYRGSDERETSCFRCHTSTSSDPADRLWRRFHSHGQPYRQPQIGEVSPWSCAGAWDTYGAAMAAQALAAMMTAHAPAGFGMLAARGLPMAALLSHADGPHLAIVNDSDRVVTAYRLRVCHCIGPLLAAPHECNSGKRHASSALQRCRFW